jgi:glycosyltransferase involved in cell wall biosynthesis
MPQPLITVLLPVYNAKPEHLQKSIESILDQTFGDFEFLIIDDGSTLSECVKLLEYYAKKDPRIRVIRNEKNIGLTKTLNEGLKIAGGTFIARQDNDDIADKQRLEKQLDFMHKNSDYALCGTWAHIIDDQNKIIGKHDRLITYAQIKKNIILINPFIHSSWFFRKSAILSLGGYTEEMIKSQDYDLAMKIAARYPVANIPEYLCFYRVSNNSISFGNNKNQEKYAILARLKAVREYGYSKWEYFKIARPIFFYLFVPSSVKKLLMKLLWKI